jgi:hypothetical protein
MKIRNNILILIGGTGLFSFISFSAMAGSSNPTALEQLVQTRSSQQLAAEGYKYNHISSIAGSRKVELVARKDEAASTYKKWHDLKSNVVKHYPSSQDYVAVEAAAKAYSHAYKAFIDLQKSILAENGIPVDKVAKDIIALR